MGLSNAGEVLQHVLYGKLHGDSRSRIASTNQIFKVLVLPDELILHGVPHHLVEKIRNRVRNVSPLMSWAVSPLKLRLSHLKQTLLFTQMFVHLLVKVVKSLLYLFARILFNNLAQLLLVEGQLVAHFLLTDTLSYAGLNSFKEMLQYSANS